MSLFCQRRQFLQLLSAGAVSLSGASLCRANSQAIRKMTYTYKTAKELEIKADVYRSDDDVIRPVVIWIHGGALILGNRQGLSGRVKKHFLDAGYAVVSIDYRLAPETKLPDIIEDVEDAYAWVHKQGPKLFRVDTKKVAVLGGSAGGYLTLTAGFRAKPRPAVLVAFWGYGDLVGDWYSQPSQFYRKTRPLVVKEDAYKGVSGPPITDGSIKRKQRGNFYMYCRQNGLWPKEIGGWDPHSEAKKFAPFEPFRNVTKDYPPTVLIHGTKDTDVPYEQSVLMAKEFKRNGVEHNFITVPDAGHGLSRGDPKLINQAYEQAFAFVERHMK